MLGIYTDVSHFINWIEEKIAEPLRNQSVHTTVSTINTDEVILFTYSFDQHVVIPDFTVPCKLHTFQYYLLTLGKEKYNLKLVNGYQVCKAL